MVSLPWEEYMKEAIGEAKRAENIGEVPVGCIIVDDKGDILGRGHNSPITLNDPCAHAEVMAIRQACNRVKNYRLPTSYMVCTLEPCIMCLGAIIHSRIQGVVFGCRDEKAGALISCLSVEKLTWLNHRFWIKWGVMEQECRTLIQDFFKKRRKDKKKMRRGTEAWS